MIDAVTLRYADRRTIRWKQPSSAIHFVHLTDNVIIMFEQLTQENALVETNSSDTQYTNYNSCARLSLEFQLHRFDTSWLVHERHWIGLDYAVFYVPANTVWETVFTGQKTQPTVSKYWRRCYKRESKQRKQLNTHICTDNTIHNKGYTQNKHSKSPSLH